MSQAASTPPVRSGSTTRSYPAGGRGQAPGTQPASILPSVVNTPRRARETDDANSDAPALQPKPAAKVRLGGQHAKALRILQDELQEFDSSWYASQEQVLGIFARLKEHQGSIEAGLKAYARVRSSPPLASFVQQWMTGLAAAIKSQQLSLEAFEVADLETMALGLVACISLGQPNLFVIKGLADADARQVLHALGDNLFKRFLELHDDLQQDHPGPCLNIQNLVPRLLKTGMFEADHNMKRMSRRCFALLKSWGQDPKQGLSGLTSSVERQRSDNPARIVKRAGKAPVQLESFCDPSSSLLPLGEDEKGLGRRRDLSTVLAWLGREEAIRFYLQAGKDGLVTLSSLAHLYTRLFDWGYLARDAGIRELLLAPLLKAIVSAAAECSGHAQVRSLDNFCGLLGMLVKPGQAGLWQDASMADLEAACSSVLAAIARLPQTGMELRASLPLFGFLRAIENWLAKRATTTTSTAAPRLTTTTTTSQAGLQSADVSRAVEQVLAGLTLEAIRAEDKAEHLGTLLDILPWLRGMPSLAAKADTLLAELVEQIHARKRYWNANSQAAIAGKLKTLEKQGLMPKPGLVQDLEQAGGKPPAQGSGKPLSFQADKKEAPAEEEAEDPWSGSIVGDRPLAVTAGQPASELPSVSASPRLVPVSRAAPEKRAEFTHVSSGPKPYMVPAVQPLATVVTEPEEEREAGPEQQPAPASGERRKKKKARKAAPLQLKAQQARAARERDLKDFDEELAMAMASAGDTPPAKPASTSKPALTAPALSAKPDRERRSSVKDSKRYKWLVQSLHENDDTVVLRQAELQQLFAGAWAGDPESQFRAGRALMMSKDEEKRSMGLRFISMAAEKKPVAAFVAGNCLRNGWGILPDPAGAVQRYHEAAKGGYARAWVALGFCHEYGIGVAKPDPDQARIFYWQGTQNDSGLRVRLLRQFADTLLEQIDAADNKVALPDTPEKIQAIDRAAQNGSPFDIYRVALMLHQDGKYRSADQAFMRAAAAGVPGAVYMLGNYRRIGWGSGKEERDALRYYRSAADLKYPRAYLALGYCHANGIGTGPDPVEAARQYQLGVDAGEPNCMFMLGLCYLDGRGVPRKDPAKGEALIEASLKANNPQLGLDALLERPKEPDPQ